MLLKSFRLSLVPFAFAFVLFIRAIARWKQVRFGEIWVSRLGHLVGNTESYLCERDAGRHPDAFDIWIPLGDTVANRWLLRKYKRALHTMPFWFGSVVVRVNQLFQDWEKHVVSAAQYDRDIYNLWWKHAPHVGFSPAEERRGARLLRSLGIPEGAKWVCLFIRDSAYLKAKAPGVDFSYHDYRDSDISDCIPAAAELARRGYYVIRMGEIVAKPFHVKHTKIIDYSLSGKRSEFADVYLTAKCAFFLGSSSGLMAIAQAFNRPIVALNFAPIEYLPTYALGLAIWKHHLKEGKRMTVAEIFAANAGLCTVGQHFTQMGIILQNNTAQEIYEVVMEMTDAIEGKIAYNKYWNKENNQDWFWNKFPRPIVNGQPLHGRMELRIGREFLKGYKPSEWVPPNSPWAYLPQSQGGHAPG